MKRNILMLSFIIISFTFTYGRTIHVKISGNDDSDGNTWETAYQTLQKALTTAIGGDEIWVAAGTYLPTNGTDRNISFEMKNNVAIYGGFIGSENTREERDYVNNETIISGNIGNSTLNTDNSFHVIFNDAPSYDPINNSAILDGFSVVEGYAFSGGDLMSGAGILNNYSSPLILNCKFYNNSSSYAGAAICNEMSSSPAINNCTFENNTAIHGSGVLNYYSNTVLSNCSFSNNSSSSNGGAVQNYGGNPQINNCAFNGNSAQNGGGIQNCEGTTVRITDCIFFGNSAAEGGGILNYNSSPVITGCTFTNNSAASGTGGEGGGIKNSNSTSVISKCFFLNNTAERYGGALRIYNSAVNITNSVFAGNAITGTGAFYGGGIAYNSSISITNCTFSNNTAYDGSALFNESSGATATVRNCIIWGNHVGDPFSAHVTDYYNMISIENSCIEGGYAGTGNIDIDPQFVGASASVEHPYSLQNTSPCADAGNNAFCSEPTDLKGDGRKLHKTDAGTPGTIDMGAYEFCTSNPLPVELTYFTANTNERGVELKWSTASEVNNYGFEVERLSVISHQSSVITNNPNSACPYGKIRNPQWEMVGFVEGNGNSNSPKQYSFVDVNNPSGNLQYRLKQIDTDGSFKYYKDIVEVNFNLTDVNERRLPKEFDLFQNYPNPFNPSTVISYQLPVSGHVTLKVYDVLGNEVASLVDKQEQPGYYNINFNGTDLSSGIYIYRLNAGSFTSTKKLMLMK